MTPTLQSIGKLGLNGTRSSVQNKPVPGFYPTYMFGHKQKLVAEILELVPSSARTFVEPFSGTGIVSWNAKKAGLRVIGNDIRRFAALQFTVLIANNDTLLTDADLAVLTQPVVATPLIERYFVKIYGSHNARFLDQWIANIRCLESSAKRDVAAWLPVFCTQRRMKYYATHLSRKGNLPGSERLIRTDFAKEMLSAAHDVLPKLVFDNGQANEAYNEDGTALLEHIEADVAFIDTPYCCQRGNYGSDLAFYDDLVRICLGQVAEIRDIWDGNCDLPPHTNFASRRTAVSGFGQLFLKSSHIPTLIVSYNTSSKISIGEIQNLAVAAGSKLTVRQEFKRPLPTNTKRASSTQEVLLRFDRRDTHLSIQSNCQFPAASTVINPTKAKDQYHGTQHRHRQIR